MAPNPIPKACAVHGLSQKLPHFWYQYSALVTFRCCDRIPNRNNLKDDCLFGVIIHYDGAIFRHKRKGFQRKGYVVVYYFRKSGSRDRTEVNRARIYNSRLALR